MKKILKGIAPSRFLSFFDYRKGYKSILCGDELEICGWYLNGDREQFKEYADKDNDD